MKPAAAIVGNWRVASTITDSDEFMHIDEDGRIVHFVFTDSSGTQTTPMMLWSENLGQDRYLIRPRPGKKGWVVGMAPTATGMKIERNEENFPIKTFEMISATATDLPDWFSDRLTTALTKMSEHENEPNRQN
jgi:hypothetical protein